MFLRIILYHKTKYVPPKIQVILSFFYSSICFNKANTVGSELRKMRHLWSDFLVVSAHQSGQRHLSTSCGSKRQDSECLNPRASIYHDSPQQPLPPAPCPVHVHISLKIQARRLSRKMCIVAGHLTLLPPTYGELGQARHEPQTLSCLWHRSGWRPAPCTPTSPAIWVPPWSRFFPGVPPG